jgi:hypothetical protein
MVLSLAVNQEIGVRFPVPLPFTKKEEIMFKIFETESQGQLGINFDNVAEITAPNDQSIQLRMINQDLYRLSFDEDVTVEEFLDVLINDDDLVAFGEGTCIIKLFLRQTI